MSRHLEQISFNTPLCTTQLFSFAKFYEIEQFESNFFISIRPLVSLAQLTEILFSFQKLQTKILVVTSRKLSK